MYVPNLREHNETATSRMKVLLPEVTKAIQAEARKIPGSKRASFIQRKQRQAFEDSSKYEWKEVNTSDGSD